MPCARLPEILRVFALASIAHLTACATPQPPAPPPKPLSAEQILRESEGMAQLGQRHKEGENLISQGEELIRQGKAQISQGERLIEAGRKIIRESEQGYSELKK